MDTTHLIAVAVGNTRTWFGLLKGVELEESAVLPSGSHAEIAKAVLALAGDRLEVPIVLSTVHPEASKAIIRSLEAASLRVERIGQDVPIPLTHNLDDASTLGQDRALCAVAAFKRAGQACVVIDAGTAVTVDFVDGEGTFQGGVIAPGLGLMLRSLHEHTAALPLLKPSQPPAFAPFGKDTPSAMLLGARNAIKGLIRETIEQYSESFGAYPQILATGGDAGSLFDSDDLVEHIIPELQLLGIAEAWVAHQKADGDD